MCDAELRLAILEMKQKCRSEQIRARGTMNMIVVVGGEGPKDKEWKVVNLMQVKKFHSLSCVPLQYITVLTTSSSLIIS